MTAERLRPRALETGNLLVAIPKSSGGLARLRPVMMILFSAIFLSSPLLRAQDAPKFIIDQDCRAFAISSQNDIVYAVPRLKFIKKFILERDDIFVATTSGKIDRIVDANKFMPFPPIEGYTVNSLSWSPDGKRIAVNMTLQRPPARLQEEIENKKNKNQHNKKQKKNPSDMAIGSNQSVEALSGGRAVALFHIDGRDIPIAGSKSRVIENATDAAWLPGNQMVVYLAGDRIVRVRPADGATTKLFEGHGFRAVAWDAARNRAFAIGEDLTVEGGLALVELDLLQQRITPIASLTSYKSSLTVSPSGTKVGFFENGDTIEVIDLSAPSKPLHVNAGLGFFQWGPREQRVLLKRGPKDKSSVLVWVGLHDDSFSPALHGLEYSDFEIAPDGNSVAITEPGKRVLKVYSLE